MNSPLGDGVPASGESLVKAYAGLDIRTSLPRPPKGGRRTQIGSDIRQTVVRHIAADTVGRESHEEEGGEIPDESKASRDSARGAGSLR